jgi:WD40 repeat protein
VWNAQSGQLLKVLSVGPINSAMLGAGPPVLLLTASDDGTARLWDPAAGTQLRVFNLGSTVEVQYAALSHDGSRVVTVHSDNTASLWNALDGQRLTLLAGHRDIVKSASFSDDGRLIVTASADQTARLWDAKSCEWLRTLEGHTDEVNKAMFSKDGRWVITISNDDLGRVWEVATGRPLAELRGHTGDLLALDLNSNANLIATASVDSTARVWRVAELNAITANTPTLTAEPSSYSGRCPVTIKFTGTISVMGSGGTVKYQFVRSSKEHFEPRELTFDSPGSKEVTDTWRLGETGFIYGWETIRILELNNWPPRKPSSKLVVPNLLQPRRTRSSSLPK